MRRWAQTMGKRAEEERVFRWVSEAEEGAVIVSANFANLYEVRAGQEVELATPQGPRRFRVVDVREDYSWPQGIVMMDLSVYRRFWEDDSITSVELVAKEGVDLAALRSDLAKRFRERHTVFIYDAQETLDYSLGLLDDYFRLANAQILIAVVIGAIGVINTLLISVLTQSRQIGLLRVVGAALRQIDRTLALEAGLIGLGSGLLGCAIGLFLAKFPLARMSRLESGYDIPFAFPLSAIGIAIGSGVLIALISSLLPIRMTRRIDLLEAIGYE